MLKAGTAVDATLISAPNSTKNEAGGRDPEMKQSKKRNPPLGMKARIGVDADLGMVHTVIGTSGNVSDAVPANRLLHGEEDKVFADSGYRGAHKRPGATAGVTLHIAVRPSDRKRLKAGAKLGAILAKTARAPP